MLDPAAEMTTPTWSVAHAIEEAAGVDPSRGFRFLSEEGVPGFRGASGAEATFSFSALERASARYGGALQALGLQKGDRCGVILPQNEDFVVAFLGAIRAGVVPVPIYPPLGLGPIQPYLDNTRHIVAKSGARAVLTTAAIKRLLGTVQEACPDLEQVLAIEGIRESLEPLRPPTLRPTDVAFLQFTSGSTSRPKGVTLTHEALRANATCIMRDGLRADPEADMGVSWLPLYHDMGLIGFVLAPLFHQVSVTFLPSLLFLKRPVSLFQAITRHRGTIAFQPNFAFALAVKRIRERDLEGLDLSSWRVAGCGAEPIRPETLEAFAQAFARVGFRREALLPSYGLAESSLAVSFSELGQGVRTLAVDAPHLTATGRARVVAPEAPDAARLVSCGRAFPGHEIRVFSMDDAESAAPLPEGEVGELRVHGPSLMTGYWEDTERTREALAGRFLRTGDLGFLHEGRVFVCGRAKDVIIVNGRNHYPQDLEWEAGRVPGVRKGSVVAFGLGDPAADRERVVVAFEATDAPVGPGAAIRAEALMSAVRRAVLEGLGLTLDDAVALAPGALPKTSSGKLQRAATRALYESGELSGRRGARDKDPVELAKQAARSQLSYLKLALASLGKDRR